MTRDEKIDWLCRLRASLNDGCIFTPWNKQFTEALDEALEQEPIKNDLGVDWDELKRKIFMEVDGGTDDKWLSYADVCDNISNSIDDFKADLPSVTPPCEDCHTKMDEIRRAYDNAMKQESIIDKIRAEIEAMSGDIETIAGALDIIDKYKAESEDKE